MSLFRLIYPGFLASLLLSGFAAQPVFATKPQPSVENWMNTAVARLEGELI